MRTLSEIQTEKESFFDVCPNILLFEHEKFSKNLENAHNEKGR